MPVLAGIGPLGLPELLIIAFVVILIFGVGRLPEVGGAVGKGIREFRKATKDDDEGSPDASASLDASSPDDRTPGSISAGIASAPADAAFCSECGSQNMRNAKFCGSCGHALTAAVG